MFASSAGTTLVAERSSTIVSTCLRYHPLLDLLNIVVSGIVPRILSVRLPYGDVRSSSALLGPLNLSCRRAARWGFASPWAVSLRAAPVGAPTVARPVEPKRHLQPACFNRKSKSLRANSNHF